jgi:hypothetical protein
VTGRQRRRSKQLLDDLNERGEYWKFKEEELDRTVYVELALEEAVDMS